MDDSRRGDHVEYSACFVRIPLITGERGRGRGGWDDVAAETSVPFESDALSAVTSSPSMENVDAGDETCSPSCELRRIVVREIILEISASKPFFY